MLKYNSNIVHSISSNTNIFSNSVDLSEQQCFDNTLLIDISPTQMDKIIWSQGFYLINPYHFDSFQTERNTLYKDIDFNLTKISYFISQLPNKPIDISKIEEDIRFLSTHFPNKTIHFYSFYKLHNHLFNLFDLTIIQCIDESDMFESCCFVVSNETTALFIQAYINGKFVVFIDTYNPSFHLINHLGKFFVIPEQLDNPSALFNVSKNVSKCIDYLNNGFTCSNTSNISYIDNLMIKMFMKNQHIVEKSLLLNNNRYDSIFIHSYCGIYYNLFYTSIQKSRFVQCTTVSPIGRENMLCCLIINETTLSKRIFNYDRSNVLIFDNTPCLYLTKTCENIYFRYYIQKFDSQTLTQNNDISDFLYNDTIVYNDKGIIVCILDNSNGLFYTRPDAWFEQWYSLITHLNKRYPDNNIYLKKHPNDFKNDNLLLQKLINSFDNILYNQSDMDIKHILDNNEVYFCLMINGSIMYKCIQLGYILLSPNFNERECVYDVYNTSIDDIIEHYQSNRKKTFLNLLDRLVSVKNLLSGKFLNQVYYFLNHRTTGN